MPQLVDNSQDRLIEANSRLLLLFASHIQPDGSVRFFNPEDQAEVKQLCDTITDCLPSETLWRNK